MIFQVGVVVAIVTAFDHFRILIVYPKSRRMIGVDADAPASCLLADIYVRHHVLGVIFTDAVTGMWVGGLNQLDDIAKFGVAGLQPAFEQGHVVIGEVLQVLARQHDCLGKLRCFRVVLSELNGHAFTR